ncbi:MAG TPA: hypothetical protein VHW94_06115 [Candidatus Dormibacteraeota bacterium]|nr:hypothetical protein [Candidatus Dormibacteraeota bacterium]
MRGRKTVLGAAVLAGLSALVAGPMVIAGGAASTTSQSLCIGHHPQEYVWYTSSCTGHDEPEIDPLSNKAGSAQDLTWTVVLPANGAVQVDSVGPTFWIGGTVTDPNSLFGQAFLELQFYPNSITTGCTAGGGYNVVYSANTYTACSPVWEVSKTGNSESAAFNAMLVDSATGGPLTMHAGDTITDHQYVTAARDGMHITVTDLTTGHAGTIVLNSKIDGPLMPAFSVQRIGNSLGWGLVHDAPNSLVWEIGHTGDYTTPAGQFCLPGSAKKNPCYSYDVPTWLKFEPIQIKGVTFGDGSSAQGWSAVSDFGGKAEVDSSCGAANYGTPFCTYPWFAYNGASKAFTYGGDYPGTTNDFGQVLQFQQQKNCVSPAGPFAQYCSTILR